MKWSEEQLAAIEVQSGNVLINAGKNVIVEKPIEITLERVDQIIKAAEEKGVIL